MRLPVGLDAILGTGDRGHDVHRTVERGGLVTGSRFPGRQRQLHAHGELESILEDRAGQHVEDVLRSALDVAHAVPVGERLDVDQGVETQVVVGALVEDHDVSGRQLAAAALGVQAGCHDLANGDAEFIDVDGAV